MYRLRKIVFWSAIGLLLFVILAPLIGSLIPIQFASSNAKSAYEAIRAFAIPLCIFLTLCLTLKKGDGLVAIISKVAGTLAVAFFSLLILAFATFDMCLWMTERVLFQKKDNPSAQIVLRSFGCGATDSSAPLLEVSTVYHIGAGLIWVTAADTTRIDRSQWVR